MSDMEQVRAPWTAPFWEGVAEHKISFQRCSDCSSAFFPPQRFCARCSSENLVWEESQGQGAVYSYTTVYKGAPQEFADEVPYTVAIVELDEGYRMTSRLVGRDADDYTVGERVEATFGAIPTGTEFPFFTPAK